MTHRSSHTTGVIILFVGATAPGILVTENIAAQERQSLPDYACTQPGRTNPVYYETSSGEWSWSPDGSSVVYSRAVGSVSQIRVQHLAAVTVQCITRGEAYDTHPNWSPSGKRIAFVRQIEGVPQIHFLTIENTAVEAVTRWPGGSEYPTFSHDGCRLAYLELLPDDARRRLLTVRDLTTAAERTIFDSPFGSRDYDVSNSNRAVPFLSPRGLPAFTDRLRSYGSRYAVTGSLAVPPAAAVAPARLASCYVDDPETTAERLDLRSVEVGANILLLEPWDSVAYERTREESGLTLVTVTQCAVDLMTGTGREPAQAESLVSWMADNEGEWRV